MQLANLAEVITWFSSATSDSRTIDASKPFDLVQQAGIERANMDVNLRGRDPVLRRAQAAQEGRIDDALQALAPSTIGLAGQCDCCCRKVAFAQPGGSGSDVDLRVGTGLTVCG